MAVNSDFRDFVKESLAPIGPISHKRMFGGAGIYAQGYIIAIIGDDELYFKTDDISRPIFEAEGLSPFTFEKKDGSVAVMSYFSAPETVFDDPDEMVKWGQIALDTSMRAPQKPKKPKKQKRY
jgi:DNA transformation protein